MFIELIKRATDQLTKGLPFVVYRKPNEGTVNAILQKDNKLHHTKKFTETGFIFSPFNSDAPSILLQIHEQLEASDFQKRGLTSSNGASPDIDAIKKEFYTELVRKGIEEINKGVLKKIVLSQRLETKCFSSPFELFQSLLSKYDSAFCYLWYHPKVGLWLGATPEILLKVANNQLTTMSLAGTQLATRNENHVDWGKKELEEQAMVTRYILNVLGNKVSDFRVSEVESVRAGNLWHLRTKITAIMKNPLSEIIKAMHPTPAVCGIPIDRAKQFIQKHEDYQRGYYTGFLGELNFVSGKQRASTERNQENRAYRIVKKSTTLYVNLRCMQLLERKAWIYVGGGITKDSEPEKEWQETLAKSKTMLGVILGKN